MNATTTTETKAPKMTAEQAKSFDTFSAMNAATVEETIAERRDCGCEAYVDVFTFNRWIAQGFVVKKGEKAIRIAVVVPGKKKDDNGDVQSFKMRKMINVFCRHQVKPLDAK